MYMYTYTQASIVTPVDATTAKEETQLCWQVAPLLPKLPASLIARVALVGRWSTLSDSSVVVTAFLSLSCFRGAILM